MSGVTDSPPRAPPIKYNAPLGTRWGKEKAAAGGADAFDLPTDPKSIGPWVLGECVGKGASGRVKIARHRRTGQLAAVKILPIAPLVNSRNSLSTQQGKSDKHRLGVDREITMMKLMNHPNIMRIYDVFEGEKELYLVLEYVEGGELFDFLVNRGRLPPQEALEYFKQIIYGLNYAHTFSIIHRDLKPENILIASLSPPLIKIADWGMAAFAPPTLQLETSCGSPHYASPEIVNGEKYQGNATDIWSCGVILYALLTGRLPFDDNNIRILLSKVKSGKYEMPTWIDPVAQDLLFRMLVVDVTKRITIPEILAHPWLTTPPIATLQTNGKILPSSAPLFPPSPSTLARPIASPALIDPELFSSLRIIWGRHADPDCEMIRRDLCSPIGHGVYTKAFYYLLNKYREDSNRKRLDDGEDLDEHLALNGISRLRFDRGWKDLLDIKDTILAPGNSNTSGGDVLAFQRGRSTSSPHASGIVRRHKTILSPSIDRAREVSLCMERPLSPFGPRPLPSPQQAPPKTCGYRPDSQASAPAPTRVLAIGPRPQPGRRGYTFSHPADKQIQFEAKPVDARISIRHGEERRRNVSLSTGTMEKRRTNGDTCIPSPTLRGNLRPKSPHDYRQNLDGSSGSPSNVRLPRVSMPATRQSRDKPSVEPVALVDAWTQKPTRDDAISTPLIPARSAARSPGNVCDVTPHSSPKVVCGTNTTPNAHTHKIDVQRRSSHVLRSRGEDDKENQKSRATITPTSTRRASGFGLGMGINHSRDVSEEMANVTYIGTGNTPVTKNKKERSKPPALEISTRRSTAPALDSPIMLSPPNTGSSTRILTSPVVGELKGWFSSLFNWKIGGHGSHGVFYSPDDLVRTCGDVANLLQSFGVIIIPDSSADPRGASAGGNLFSPIRLKCRVEELSVDAQANVSLKPVRFSVEFTAMQPRPLVHQSLFSPPLSPIMDNTSFFLPPPIQDDGTVHRDGNHTALSLPQAPNPGLTPRVRTSMLPVMMRAPSSGQNTPMPSPGLSELHIGPTSSLGGNDGGDGRIPCGSMCAILLLYEKGSTTSFKTVWKKVKEFYCESPTKTRALLSPDGLGTFSPLMASTPISQACPTGQFGTARC